MLESVSIEFLNINTTRSISNIIFIEKTSNSYKQKIIQFIRRNQVYFSSSNVSTDTTVIVKD